MSYASRRQGLLDACDGGPVMVCGAGPGEGNAAFRYLTGHVEPKGVLLLSGAGIRVGTGRANPGPDYQRGRRVHQLLFLPQRDALLASWGEDGSATVEAVDAESEGYDAVLPVGALKTVLPPALRAADRLHFVRSAQATIDGDDDADTVLVDRLRRRFFHLRLVDAEPTVSAMRSAKDADEVAAIERSIGVTAEALDAALAAIRPGGRESDVEAEIVRVYRSHLGVHAFDPIVGAGANAMLLHYGASSGPIEPGGLVLIDTGVRIDGYCSDVTRTVPVDGRFSPRQREIYEIVLEAQRQAIALCRPGVLLGDLHAKAWEVIDAAGYGEFFPHGTSHHLGLETHDAGEIGAPLKPGAVVTVEPGIYVPDEAIGVRIEDDVLVTAAGPRVLSEAIPKSVEAVEAWMAAVRR